MHRNWACVKLSSFMQTSNKRYVNTFHVWYKMFCQFQKYIVSCQGVVQLRGLFQAILLRERSQINLPDILLNYVKNNIKVLKANSHQHQPLSLPRRNIKHQTLLENEEIQLTKLLKPIQCLTQIRTRPRAI